MVVVLSSELVNFSSKAPGLVVASILASIRYQVFGLRAALALPIPVLPAVSKTNVLVVVSRIRPTLAPVESTKRKISVLAEGAVAIRK